MAPFTAKFKATLCPDSLHIFEAHVEHHSMTIPSFNKLVEAYLAGSTNVVRLFGGLLGKTRHAEILFKNRIHTSRNTPDFYIHMLGYLFDLASALDEDGICSMERAFNS